jgi:hypothetical protein
VGPPRLGAVPEGSGAYALNLLAPRDGSFALGAADGLHPLERQGELWRGAFADGEYHLVVDGVESHRGRCARFQAYGVRDLSAVVDTDSLVWSDDTWEGVAREGRVLYEPHVELFTEEPRFDLAMPRLRAPREFGVTNVDLADDFDAKAVELRR